MKRFVPMFLCLSLVVAIACFAVDSRASDQEPFFVHFVVVSKTMPDGSDSEPALLKFKEEVVKLAGGFTELGPTVGDSLTAGGVQYQDNISFIIGAKKDISMELKAMSKRLFKGDGAFIMAWPGTVIF